MISEQIVNGLTLGSIYALIALGYTLVYGILMMINFAHSEIFMLGAYFGLVVLTAWPASASGSWLGLLAVFAVGMLGSAVLAALMERIAYRPLRGAGRLAPLISAIGVSLLLQNAVFIYDSHFIPFPNLFAGLEFSAGPLRFSGLQVFILAAALLLMAGLHVFIKFTRMGKAIRACSQDREAASLMGIPVSRTIGIVFFIGGALGGAAGILYGMNYGAIKYNMGFVPGIKAFTAAVLGGIGNIPGAVFGGYLLGFLEAFGGGFLPEAEWKDVFAFVVLIGVLLLRPGGLLGEHVSEKV